MTARKDSNLDNLTIAPSCKITRLEIDYTNDKASLVTIEETTYTPKHIADSFHRHNITGSAWVIGPVGKELWKLNGELARQVK